MEWKRFLVGVVGLVSGACGGANLEGQAPGTPRGGVALASGDIAVHPDGMYFLLSQDDALLLGDLEQGTLEPIPAVAHPYRLAFWPREVGTGFVVLSREASNSSSTESIHSFDIPRRQATWARTLDRLDYHLDVSGPAGRVLLSGGDVALLDLADGLTVGTLQSVETAVDLDLTPDGKLAVVTQVTRWDGENRDQPHTPLSVHRVTDGVETCRLDLPNCASTLVMTPDGKRAFLAPTSCRKDPVSVVDLEGTSCRLVRNLPGFGPVALAQKGTVAVAFLDRDAVDPTAPALPEAVVHSPERYHLAFIDVDTLEMDTLAVGDLMPRYAVTPDGSVLLVDVFLSSTQVRVLDVARRSLTPVAGPSVQLNNFVLTPDSQQAYAVDRGLFRIDIALAQAASVPLGFVPTNLNINPAGTQLLLRDVGQRTIRVFDLAQERVVSTLTP